MANMAVLPKILGENQIIAQILVICNKNKQATKLQIMFHTYLSDNQCKEFLCNMVKNGWLVSDETKVYSITHKGLRLLQAAR